ncbi:ATP-grasp domain-containing protein [Priestia megaterium]|uniref:ATP-grasp domain-containing protein n=1 Tax=Priestia megaterium TaxID=1404 RepID=UPI002E22E31B|nr:ATP-grasp domain-containing protein [Priestia megaterium]MED4278709.1 ATP-grasp domain-containing protein [Priestia megaterium]MED4314677.1 ATP-grasp domain-containing protein [Priestia megaterium]
MNNRKLGLIMRKGYKIQEDHIETLGRLVDHIHIWTNIEESVNDPRFQYVHIVQEDNEETLVNEIYKEAIQHGINKFITFQETDIILTSKINNLLKNQFLSVEVAEISRDKSKQREFMSKYNLPTPSYFKVDTIEEAIKVSEKISYPFILKPTLAASSSNVSLVKNEQQLIKAFEKLEELRHSKKGYYYNNSSQSLALIEEFLCGDEVTVDGVVANSEFYLGGIHNKKRMNGPYFEEDEYTLPYNGSLDSEKEISSIVNKVCECLKLKETLFNVELRKDKNGVFKIVEFSVRVSGGHVYRNIRDVYGIDLIGVHISSIFHDEQGKDLFSRRFTDPKVSTCIKFIYREGLIEKNNVGKALDSPYFRAYYPTASIGEYISCAPNGFDIVGLLSVRCKYTSLESISEAINISKELEKKLNLKVSAKLEKEVINAL